MRMVQLCVMVIFVTSFPFSSVTQATRWRRQLIEDTPEKDNNNDLSENEKVVTPVIETTSPTTYKTSVRQTVETKTLRPLHERICGEDDSLVCVHGVPKDCSSWAFSCICDEGWSEMFCNKPCTLGCVNGTCFNDGQGQTYCSCVHGYTGALCDQRTPTTAGPLPALHDQPSCPVNNCLLRNPCQPGSKCINNPNCRTMRCEKQSDLSTDSTPNNTPILTPVTESADFATFETSDPSTIQTTTLRPLDERICNGDSLLECFHGVPKNCSPLAGFACNCDTGWDGDILCKTPCTLECVYGNCFRDNGAMICSCMSTHTGQLCDQVKPDPEAEALFLATVLSSVLAVVLLVALVTPIIMWRMRVLLILKLVYYFKEYEDDDGKLFDAYVSMTSTASAESFVYGWLTPRLEGQNFKLYLQSRDTQPGEMIGESILSALEQSRRTIMIITRDYITNEWNRFEYLIAQHETLKLQQRIIPIILEDVKQDRTHMNKSLKHILDSIKSLKFPQTSALTSPTPTISSDVQSPDSVNSTTYFQVDGSCPPALSKEAQTTQKKMAKFWKQLELTMPKKKSPKKSSNMFVNLLRGRNYKITENPSKMKNGVYVLNGSNKPHVEIKTSNANIIYASQIQPTYGSVEA